MDDRKRDRFGRYEILSELGQGAMGVVYKARDPKINRVVAVKTISLIGHTPEDESEFRERFVREAEAAGRLSHPGIVTIFDVGEEPETRAPYIVMEYVGGESLDKLLSRGEHNLPVETALQLTLELAEALDCAHGQGVVHRDLKPANILLTEDNKAKIADFGVAKLNFGTHTLGARALGTPAYMSPEQLNGETVDGRSDLFSLGVILYTMLTGYRPFQGNSAITISFKVVNREPVPATILNTALPPGLDYIIARAMAKDPAQRYQRGMEIVFDIEALREGREPWSKAKQPSRPAGGDPGQKAKDIRPPTATRTGSDVPQGPNTILQPQRTLVREIRESIGKRGRLRVLLFVGVVACGILALSTSRRPGLPRTSAPLPVSPIPSMTTAGPVLSKATTTVVPTDVVAPPSAPGLSPSTAKKTVLVPAKPQRTPAATLQIEVDHRFSEAQLSIWVDDNLTYTHMLEGADKKHLVVFHHVQGHELHVMQLPAGTHRLRVRVTSDAAGGGTNYDQITTLDGNFSNKRENVLHINCTKHGEIEANLQ